MTIPSANEGDLLYPPQLSIFKPFVKKNVPNTQLFVKKNVVKH